MSSKNKNSEICVSIVIISLIFSFCVLSSFKINNLNSITKENLSESSSLDFQDRKEYPSGLLQESTDRSPNFPSSGFIRNQGQITDDSIEFYCSTNGFFIGFSTTEIKFWITSIQGLNPNYFIISFDEDYQVFFFCYIM